MRHRQDPLPNRNLREDVVNQMRRALRHSSPATRRANRPALARERDQTIEPAAVTAEPREAAREPAAPKEPAKLLINERRQPLTVPPGCCLGGERLIVIADDLIEHAVRGTARAYAGEDGPRAPSWRDACGARLNGNSRDLAVEGRSWCRIRARARRARSQSLLQWADTSPAVRGAAAGCRHVGSRSRSNASTRPHAPGLQRGRAMSRPSEASLRPASPLGLASLQCWLCPAARGGRLDGSNLTHWRRFKAVKTSSGAAPQTAEHAAPRPVRLPHRQTSRPSASSCRESHVAGRRPDAGR